MKKEKMRLVWIAPVSLLAAVLVPLRANAQDAITGVAIETHATFNNAGVMVTYTGDANGDAAAALEVDVDGAGFAGAHPLSRAGAGRFVGSAFFLPDGTEYSLRVTLEDPDGVTNGTLTASGVTRLLQIPESSGETFHVAVDGDDGNDGSEAFPLATVAAGVSAASAGDTVLIHAGEYHEEITVTGGGSDGAPVTIRSYGDGEVVLTGASPALCEAGAWTSVGGGVYSAPVAQTWFVAVDDVRMWRYESLVDLQALSLGTDGGFYFEAGTVYLRLPGDAAPAGHEIEVSELGRAFWLEGAPNVVIRDVTIRAYGGEEYSEGIMVRDGSFGVWIAGCAFEHVMPGIWVKNDVDDLTVMDNEFSDNGLAEFSWSAVKAQGGMESGALAVDGTYDGQGIVFYRNHVHDSFDGIHICGQEPMSHPNNADVLANTFFHLADDGIETDGDCSNVRIALNRFEQSLCGVSAAPAAVGPTYVIRNLMVDLRNVAPDSDWMTRALKFNVDDPRPSGDVFVYHNTAVTYEAEQAAFGVTDDSVWTAVHLKNNIWVGTGDAFYYENTGLEPFYQDYDLLYSTGDGFVTFDGGHYDTVEAYFDATGLCEHCLGADPAFVDGSGGDYELLDSSEAIDRGTVIPGVDDDYVGGAPDIGAYELGGVGPDADTDSDADSDADADSDTDSGADADGGADAGGSGEDTGSCGCHAVGSAAAPRCSLLELFW
jgi:hypothetical protein